MRAPRGTRRSGKAEPSAPDGDLQRARQCYARREWLDAHRGFAAADRQEPLADADLEHFALSASLTAQIDDFFQLMERLYQTRLGCGNDEGAARCAFWMGMRWVSMRETSRGSGWLARAQRLTEGKDCAERGFLSLSAALRSMVSGDYDAAGAAAATAVVTGDRFHEPDLSALGRCLHGRVLIRQGHLDSGLPLLDEAMVAATAGELGPVATGLIYCNAIAACHQVYAMDRAREWTAALASWCAAQPDLVPFSGTCLVHRAELMQIGGAWREAIDEAQRAAARVSPAADAETAADSFYQQGEIHRLRGDSEAAERAYRNASALGREAQPGLALLRLCQGRAADAASALRRVLRATSDRLARARLLPAHVEIMLAAGDRDEARAACGELEQIAGAFETEVLGAMAAHARGALALADGDAEAALAPLRHAFRVWRDAGAPYIAARLRVLLAQACRALGDDDSATLEIGLAREVFERLGAAPDLAALQRLHEGLREDAGTSRRRGGLSPRELEVLRLVASGKTNKAIARQLCLSEKTIDRHVSNIFTKVNVASRAAATAYAYENGLI